MKIYWQHSKCPYRIETNSDYSRFYVMEGGEPLSVTRNADVAMKYVANLICDHLLRRVPA